MDMVYPIAAYGLPVLRQKAQPIEIGTSLGPFIETMLHTMKYANGAGLAAPQVNQSIRLFTLDITYLQEKEPEHPFYKGTFINPIKVAEEGDAWALQEGCLSVPDIYVTVSRPANVTLRYYDEAWKEQEHTFTGMLARVIQHEYDHLEGILHIDYAPTLQKKMLKGKLEAIRQGKIEPAYQMIFAK